MKKVFLAVLFPLLFLQPICAQDEQSWESLYEQISGDEEDDLPSKDEVYEQLCQLAEHPLDLNTVTREQLEQLPFLSDIQIEELLYYRYLYKRFESKEELMGLRSLDYYRRCLLSCFVYVGEAPKPGFPSLKNILKYGKHQITGMVKIPFYERKGDKKGYLGYPYKHYLKYDFHYGDRVKAGIVASQDAGEPFFSGKNKLGYDYYSYYIMVKNLGRIRTLALGKYRVSWGLGLVVNNDFSLGKLITLSTLGRNTTGIKAHSSLSSYNYQQGIATDISLSTHFNLSAFLSYRPIDATINNGSSTIATILSTGYHRTKSELLRKNNASQFTSGLRLGYTAGALRLGLNGVYTRFDHDLQPNLSQAFRRYYPQGNNFYNLSLDYSYAHYLFTVKGETALDQHQSVATLNTIGVQISSSLTAMLLQRFYSYRYNALLANSFSSGGRVQNESGVYLGISYKPNNIFDIMAYTDIAYFPWKRYQVSASSHAYDQLVQASWHQGSFAVTARYQLKMRQKDNTKKTALIYDTTHRGRLWASYADSTFSNRTQVDFALSRYKQQSVGWMVSNILGIAGGKHVKLNLTLGYFHTADYASRLYVYEPGLLYTFSYGMFYGKGVHGALNLRYSLGTHWLFIAKLSSTKYNDRKKISSGLNEINHSSMTDLQLQVKLKL